MSDILLPCPFCGGNAYFTRMEDMDDRRYYQLEVQCDGCEVKREATIGWVRYSKMTPTEAERELREQAAKYWNQRQSESEELEAAQSLVAEALEKDLRQTEMIRAICRENDELRKKLGTFNQRVMGDEALIALRAEGWRVELLRETLNLYGTTEIHMIMSHRDGRLVEGRGGNDWGAVTAIAQKLKQKES